MKKEINIKYTDKLEQAIKEAEGKAYARTLTVNQIKWALGHVEKKLNIPKKYMDGITVDIDVNAQDFPRAYKGKPESTQFSARYKNGSWRVTSISREHTKTEKFGTIVKLTEEAKTKILAKYTSW